MRKIYLATLFSIVYVIASFGQCDVCTPDLTCTSPDGMPAFCPSQIPDAIEGVFYSQPITFYLPDTISLNGLDLELLQVNVDSINGLPEGIEVSFPNDIATFYPSQGDNYVCLTLCGVALMGGTFSVDITITGMINTFFGPTEFPPQNYSFDFIVLGVGCIDSLACNYDPTATIDNGSCGPDLGSICDDSLNTTMNDVITIDCDCAGTLMVFGCTNVSACNFNASATVDDGTCGAALGASCNDNDSTTTSDVIVEGCLCSGVSEIAGCTSLFSCNYNPEATIDDGSCLGFFGSACDDGDSSTVNDQVNFDCTCLGSPIIEGCTQQTACNYEPAANVDNGSCGETIGAPCDDNDPTTSNDAIINGCSCAGVTGVPGCTDFLACNYNPQATVDDGSCGAQLLSPCDDGDATTTNDITLPGCDCMGTPSVAGCTNPLACNYNPLAVTDDGSCGPPTGSLCDDGDANTSNDIILPGCLCVGNPLGINDFDRDKSFSIYPNPANQFVVIINPLQGQFHYRMLNLTGEVILSGSNDHRIDVSHLNVGLYLLTIETADGHYLQSIEILR